MTATLQLDLRSWWIGAYLNTSRRELYLCILFLVVTLAPRTRMQAEMEF